MDPDYKYSRIAYLKNKLKIDSAITTNSHGAIKYVPSENKSVNYGKIDCEKEIEIENKINREYKAEDENESYKHNIDEQTVLDFLLAKPVLTPYKLVIASVYTLLKRPNHSCKISSFAAEVLRYLRIGKLGKERDVFITHLNKTISTLKRNKIIEVYWATNKRIRLVKDYYQKYIICLQRLDKKKIETDNILAVKSDKSLNDSMEVESELSEKEESSENITSADMAEFPELPEPKFGLWQEENELDINPDIKYNNDQELCNYTDNTQKTASIKSMFDVIKDRLEADWGIEAKFKYNELVFYVDIPSTLMNLQIFIEYSKAMNILHLRSLLPYNDKAVIKLLELSGAIDYVSIIGISNYNNNKSFIVRKPLSVSDMSGSDMIDTIYDFIRDALSAAKIALGA
jgi:hypothetical protein